MTIGRAIIDNQIAKSFNDYMDYEHGPGQNADNTAEVAIQQFIDTHPNILTSDVNGNMVPGSDMDDFKAMLQDMVSPELYAQLQGVINQMVEDEKNAPDVPAKQQVVMGAFDLIFRNVIEQLDYAGGTNPFTNNLNFNIWGSETNVLVMMMLVFAEMTNTAQDIMRTDALLMGKNNEANKFLNDYKIAMTALNSAGTMPLKILADPEISWLEKDPEDGKKYIINNAYDLFRLVYGKNDEGELYSQGAQFKSAVDPLYQQLKENFPEKIKILERNGWVWDPDITGPTFNNMFESYQNLANDAIGSISTGLTKMGTWTLAGNGSPVLDSTTNQYIATALGQVDTATSQGQTLSNTLLASSKFHQENYQEYISLLMKPATMQAAVLQIIQRAS